jgi:mono/diheme cytochrome c family protein
MTKFNHGISSFMNLNGMKKAAGVMALGVLLSGCRGMTSEKSPVHPNMNMDQQKRVEAQEVNNFFADGRAMRQPVEGTVARGFNKEDVAFYEGVDENGDWIEEMPAEMTKSFLYRGKERYEIYCAPCHGITGDGQGIIMTGGYGYVPAPTYHQDRLREAPDGEIYSAIYNGVRTMPSYAHQIKAEDRWAIVGYIRALQASQYVSEDEIAGYDVDLDAIKAEYQAEQEKLAEIEAAQSSDAPEPTIDLGKEVVAANGCAACHNVDGAPNGIGPTWKDAFGSEAEVINQDGEYITVTKDEDYIRESILNPEAKKTRGYESGVMVAYDYLAEHEVESIILYIKSLSDN